MTIVKPTINEVRWIIDQEAIGKVTGSLIAMEHFICYASKSRKIPKPWLCIQNSKLKSREGCIDIKNSTILIGSCSWLTLLHEWCHWVIGCKYGWDESSTDKADLVAEAYARSIVYFVNPVSQEAKAVVEAAQSSSVNIPSSVDISLASLTFNNVRLLCHKLGRS